MALQIFTATAGFLSKWYTSEEQLAAVTERYKDKFKIFKEFPQWLSGNESGW